MISKIILNEFSKRKYGYKVKVILTYFRESGKYYSEGIYMEDYLPLYKIWEKIENMKKHPGLSMKWRGFISVDVPDHINNHPHLIIMKENK
jgi:hypothetical protein